MIKLYQTKPTYIHAVLVTEHFYDWMISPRRMKAVQDNTGNPGVFKPIHTFTLPELPNTIVFKYNWMTDRMTLVKTGGIVRIGDYIAWTDDAHYLWDAATFESYYEPVPPKLLTYELIPLTPEENHV